MNKEPLSGKYRDVLRHLKKKEHKKFQHIIKAGKDFQDAMFNYISDFIFHEMVPDTYDYTKLFAGRARGVNLS